MKQKRSALIYIIYALIAVNSLLYIFKVRIPFPNRFTEILYGVVLTIVVVYVFYLDRKKR
jgi:predicted nucleic acid-binding Zn ribbon protein